MKRLIKPELPGFKATAFFTGKDPGDDLAELGRLCHIAQDRIYLPIQKHTDVVQVLEADLDAKIADAVVTARNDLLIGVRVADCLPVLLYDHKRRVIGAVHAGWRGTAAGILKKTIDIFTKRFMSDPSDIFVAVGPGIRWCCYEVDPDVVHAVEAATGSGDFARPKGTKYHLDLPAANKIQAVSKGIRPENIWTSADCTFCNPDKFCSYRYAKGTTCRQAGFIGMI